MAERAREEGVTRYNQLRRGISSSSDLVREEDYLYLRFGKEITEARPEYDDDDVIVLDEDRVARTMLFCVTEDRRFAYQSRQGVTAEDAVRYLLEDDVDDVDQNISYDIVGEFQKEVTKNIYTNADFVRSLKLKNIGLRSDSSVNNGIVDSLDNASGNTDTIEISTGNGENDDDLSLVEAIDGLARLSDIDRIRTRTEDGKIEEVGLNGRYTYTHSKDVTDENQAQNLRDAIDYVYSDLL
ncbi:hypothetical protein [Halalkalicoccus jeotgali]|uniref:hypothetical protein n=1 Tax=Halalkalicoccus jeotgali TaxID=413810 RepID=UPI0011D1F8D8|nr:hypothetical protein [Halalkalicoccus jeotgali]